MSFGVGIFAVTAEWSGAKDCNVFVMFFSSRVHQRGAADAVLGQPRSGPDGGGESPRGIVQGRHPLWSGESRSGSIWDPKSRNWSGTPFSIG